MAISVCRIKGRAKSDKERDFRVTASIGGRNITDTFRGYDRQCAAAFELWLKTVATRQRKDAKVNCFSYMNSILRNNVGSKKYKEAMLSYWFEKGFVVLPDRKRGVKKFKVRISKALEGEPKPLKYICENITIWVNESNFNSDGKKVRRNDSGGNSYSRIEVSLKLRDHPKKNIHRKICGR